MCLSNYNCQHGDSEVVIEVDLISIKFFKILHMLYKEGIFFLSGVQVSGLMQGTKNVVLLGIYGSWECSHILVYISLVMPINLVAINEAFIFIY